MSKIHRRVRRKAEVPSFDKYELYKKAVQSPETDVLFLEAVFKELKSRKPESFREDFCGTFSLALEWVKLRKEHHAVAIDLDPGPLEYGRQHYLPLATPDQQKRLKIIEGNVLDVTTQADLVAAMNFSYFLFKRRSEMKAYFQSCLNHVKKNGILVLDLFGGSACYAPNEEMTALPKFNYYWDQESFDPITNEAHFHIHFKVKGQKKTERVFSYDWRMWSIPELRELLLEVGFARTHVYWEGTTKKGEGDGKFTRTEKGEDCQSWIAYLISEK